MDLRRRGRGRSSDLSASWGVIMCGIAGFVRHGDPDPVDGEVLRRMTRTLAHRGPDDEGTFEEEGVFLGHRRLSVIDLEGGRQPMASEDGRVVVVFNGEIYNHKDLRRDLEARGHAFRTRADTEVLVHLWEDEAQDMLPRLNGMFAFALWDRRDRTLLLARDRMGKKPLYWGEFSGEFVFASELRALLQHPVVPREVDADALHGFLTLDYVPTPRCILRGLRKVPGGGYVLIRGGHAREGTYADIPIPRECERVGPDEAARRVFDALVAATGRRLESDVPLGVFLSGGLDSTAVVAAMAEHVPAADIRTFTIGFDDPTYDESGPARAVAERFGTEHHERTLTGRDAIALVRDCAGIADEPLGDYSLIPTHLLARFAREHVTVALSGDGGDELFYGYPTFAAHRLADRIARLLPRVALERWLPGLVDWLPPSDADWSLEYRLKRLVRGLRHGPFARHFAWIGGLDPEAARGVMHPELRARLTGEAAYPDVDAVAKRVPASGDMRTLAYLYARLYLQDGVLVKVDRASMAVGLEVRSPFLDPDMVALAFSLPPGLSMGRLATKVLLRRALKGRVPDAIVRRPKKGFGMPLARWLRTDLKPLMLELLSPRRLAREGTFDPEAVRALVEAHLSGRANLRKELFNLMVFELWLSRYLL